MFTLGAQLCILVFSTVDRQSFDAIDSWVNKVSVFPTINLAINVMFMNPQLKTVGNLLAYRLFVSMVGVCRGGRGDNGVSSEQNGFD